MMAPTKPLPILAIEEALAITAMRNAMIDDSRRDVALPCPRAKHAPRISREVLFASRLPLRIIVEPMASSAGIGALSRHLVLLLPAIVRAIAIRRIGRRIG